MCDLRMRRVRGCYRGVWKEDKGIETRDGKG